MLELGAGCGLLSILAGRNGASKVVATDLDTTQLEVNIKQNISNTTEGHLTMVKCLSWGDAKQAKALDFQPDLIIGSEILYLFNLHDDLLVTLDALSSDSTKVLMSFKKRNLGEEGFLDKARARQWNVEFVKLSDLHRDFQTGDYIVFWMTR